MSNRVVHLDDLIESVPQHLVQEAENRTQGIKISKRQRIRDYMRKHPNVPNKAVVAALKDYGVNPQEVSQIRCLLKQRSISVPVRTNPPQSAISLSALEAGVAFVKAAGSITNAKHLLLIIEQIKTA